MANSILSRLREKQQSYILFTFLRKPYSIRDAANRGLVVAAIIAAIVLPIFIGRGGGDATAGAGVAFAAQLAELEEARLERDESGSSDELDARIEQLEAATRLGYLERDGDASDKGALAPDFRLLDLEGEPHVLSEIDGPIVLNFWASWCEPCIEEMPEFEIVSQEAAGRVHIHRRQRRRERGNGARVRLRSDRCQLPRPARSDQFDDQRSVSASRPSDDVSLSERTESSRISGSAY